MASKAFDWDLGQVVESKLFTIHLKSNMLNDQTTKIDQIDFNRVSDSLSQWDKDGVQSRSNRK